jgi:hypothetical protein
LFIVAHLEETGVALLASLVVATVPRAADTIALLPSLLGLWDGSDLTNDLMTRNDGEAIAKAALLDNTIRVADSAC